MRNEKKNKTPANLVYSDKEKFGFIQLGKVGSSSIMRCLMQCTKLECKNNSSKAGRGSLEFPLNNEIFKVINDTHFTFIFVRNPWDRIVSFYENKFKKKNNNFAKAHKISNSKNISFKSFICDFLINDTLTSNKHWCIQSDMSFIGEINFIGRFENLQKDFHIICDKIGIPRQKMPHKNATKHKHYTEYYDEETKQIVAEKYAKDIEYFGYEFGK